MNEIAQAREDRLGQSLRQQLVAFIKDVTLRVHLRQLTLNEPKVALVRWMRWPRPVPRPG
ncbi:hypothetical protein [Streptomyces melanogenes]|uniref:hypothetical protein n=1 Tax=Streptomyces melanogenes TaxID=67326 RepID=UPI0037B5DED6